MKATTTQKCKDLFLSIASKCNYPLDSEDSKQLLYLFNADILQQSQPKSTSKIDYLKACKTYIDKMDDSRPALKGIQRKADGTQFVLNGYSAYIFNNSIPALDILPQTPTESCIKIENIIPKNVPEYTMTDNDRFVWDNLKAIKKAMQNDLDNKNGGKRDTSTKLVAFCGRSFDIDMLLTCQQFIEAPERIEAGTATLNPITITDNKVLALLLPVRAEYQTIATHTQTIIETIQTLNA